MSHKRPVLETLMSYWPLVMALFSVISSVAVLYYRVNSLENTSRRQWELISKNREDLQELRIKVAKFT